MITMQCVCCGSHVPISLAPEDYRKSPLQITVRDNVPAQLFFNCPNCYRSSPIPTINLDFRGTS